MSALTYYLLLDTYIEKEEIDKIATEYGFKKIDERGKEHIYLWKGIEYESLKGCHFSFGYDVNLSDDINNTHTYKTVCGTTTVLGRSYVDQNKQFEIIKAIQDLYGGKVYDPNNNSWGLRENEMPPQLSKTEIACGIENVHFSVDLSRINNHLIQEVDISKKWLWRDAVLNRYEYPESLKNNNRLVIDLITIFETFLKGFFTKYLKTNEGAYTNFITDFKTDKELSDEQMFEKHLRRHNFQNLDSANKAYKKYLNFNLKQEVLNTQVISGGEVKTIGFLLNELLNIRHKKIHEGIYSSDLNKEKTILYRDLVKIFGNTFIEKFMKTHNLRLLIEIELGY
ncbi:hypothetical protein COJ00_27045 [Priestia megaterium]|uniref:hypothetical protein n=1 Tax=Priestia megaterium TaxID=1404 RepID=UPI000BF53779|nr:hypothetical protein [Priestia megaterium]PFJ40189.1 hypothetical protein COJ00_27045 [Priestia megaterium]